MAISSSATGLRPGVCTSTTRPTAPYTGQIIFETDTGYLRVWDGSAWDYLSQKQDTAEALPPETYMGLVKVIPTSVSSVGGTAATLNSTTGNVTVGVGNTSITVTCFSSLYDNYKIMTSGGASSVNAVIQMRLGSNTTNYYSSATGVNSGSAAVVGRRQNSVGYMDYCGYGTIYGLQLNMEIQNPFLAKLKYATSSFFVPTGDMYTTLNYVDDIVSYTSFTLLLSTGTFQSGTIRVYGYRN